MKLIIVPFFSKYSFLLILTCPLLKGIIYILSCQHKDKIQAIVTAAKADTKYIHKLLEVSIS